MNYGQPVPKKSNALKTPQGRNTLVHLLACSILGIVLSEILPVFIEKLQPYLDREVAQKIGMLLALVISSIVLVTSLLKPSKRVSPLQKQLLKAQEKSDGS